MQSKQHQVLQLQEQILFYFENILFEFTTSRLFLFKSPQSKTLNIFFYQLVQEAMVCNKYFVVTYCL